MRIEGFKIPVTDLDASVAFFRDKLGFSVDFAAAEFGWASISREGAALGLYVPGMGGGNRQPGGSIDFTFVEADLAAFHTALRAAGVAASDIIETADSMRLFEVVDPAGNEIAFRQG